MAEPAPPEHHDDWDAGDMGCGELVLELRFRMDALAPGQVIRLRATDPGAPEDLPAWCRMTRHQLVHHDPDAATWWIARRPIP